MNQRRPHNLTLRYCLYQSTFFLSCAGIFGFAVTYLLEKGFQTAEIGMMIAASNFVSCIAQPFLGDFADRFPKIRLTSMIAVCLVCCLLCFATIQMCRLPLVMFGILYTVGGLAITLTPPLGNALCVYYSERDYKVDYGIGSGVGSLSYSFATLSLGYVIASLGTDWMVWIVLVSLCTQLVITLGYPKILERDVPARQAQSDAQQLGQRVSLWSFFLKYKFFMITVSGVMMIAMCHSMAENFLINMFQPMGADSRSVGTALAIASFSAAPLMIMFEKLQKKINIMALMRLSGIFYVLKAVLMFFATNVWQVYAIVCLQTFTYGFIYPSLFYFTQKKIAKADMVKGQAVVVAAFTMGTALGSFVGGKAIDAFSFQVMILLAGLLAGLGTIIVNCNIKK